MTAVSEPARPPGRIPSLLTAPLRFARRRPLLLAGGVFAVVALAAGGTWGWFEYHLRAARREVERGHNGAARRHLDACHSLAVPHRELLILSARVARRTGAWDDAEAALDRLSERFGDDDELVLERLLLRATRGDIEAAGAPLLSRVVAGGAEARLAREALVAGLVYRFRWAEADAVLAGWLSADPDDPIAVLLRGKLEEQRQNPEAAARSYRRVVELDPEHDEARLRLTTLLLTNRFGAEALAHLEVLRGRLPDHPEVGVQWARALALEGRTAESRAAIAACLAAHPDYPPALAERGGFALLDGDEAAAARDLERAVELSPGDLAARAQLALVLARAGRREDAARRQAEVDQMRADGERVTALIEGPLQSRPGDPAVPHEIAQIALRAGQVGEALRWFEVALRADPDHAPTHRVLAALHHELGNPALSARHRALAQRAARPKS
ncbi:MAG: tetratricopeptide repeat protein [Gemmataceae bacterium]